MNTFGIDRRWSGQRGVPPWVGRRRSFFVAVAVVAIGLVFACFFAIGRATAPGSARAEVPSTLPVTSTGATIPVQLASAPPIDIFVPAPPPPRPTPQPRTQPTATQTTPAPAQTVAPTQSSAPAPTPTPEPAPSKPATPAPAPHTSTPSTPSSGGGSSHGGGTFESSG